MESTLFYVEYRWKKITKMGEISAKTYSMWNGQNPCGIRGHGKDLQMTLTRNRVPLFQCHYHHLLALFLQDPSRLSPLRASWTKIFKLIISGHPGVSIHRLTSLELSGLKGYMRVIWCRALLCCKMLLVMLTSLSAFLTFSMACHSNRRHTSLIKSSDASSLHISGKRRVYSLILLLDSGLSGERISQGGTRELGTACTFCTSFILP